MEYLESQTHNHEISSAQKFRGRGRSRRGRRAKLSQIARQVCAKLPVFRFVHQRKGAQNCRKFSFFRSSLDGQAFATPTSRMCHDIVAASAMQRLNLRHVLHTPSALRNQLPQLSLMGHTPSTAGTFRKRFRKDSGKTPETLSERFLEFPSRVRLGCPKPYNSRHLRLTEHLQNYLPPSTAGGASFFGSGSGEGLPEPVMEFPAVPGVSLSLAILVRCQLSTYACT